LPHGFAAASPSATPAPSAAALPAMAQIASPIIALAIQSVAGGFEGVPGCDLALRFMRLVS
jgi:hypothetical protein